MWGAATNVDWVLLTRHMRITVYSGGASSTGSAPWTAAKPERQFPLGENIREAIRVIRGVE
mgnify:FL=1